MSYDGTKPQLKKEISEKEALDVLEDLVDQYIANIGTKHEFISCITPNGPMIEWEQAKRVLKKAGRL